MPTRRRLIIAFILTILLAASTIWLARQYKQIKLNRALIAAIKESDASRVDALLAAGADPNTRDVPEKKLTLIDRLKQLIHAPPPDLSPTVLFVAIDQWDRHTPHSMVVPSIVSALLAKGADPNSIANCDDRFRWIQGDLIVPIGRTPLFKATLNDSTQCVSVLLNYGANPYLPTPTSDHVPTWQPLEWAQYYCRFDIVKLLDTHGAKR